MLLSVWWWYLQQPCVTFIQSNFSTHGALKAQPDVVGLHFFEGCLEKCKRDAGLPTLGWTKGGRWPGSSAVPQSTATPPRAEQGQAASRAPLCHPWASEGGHVLGRDTSTTAGQEEAVRRHQQQGRQHPAAAPHRRREIASAGPGIPAGAIFVPSLKPESATPEGRNNNPAARGCADAEAAKFSPKEEATARRALPERDGGGYKRRRAKPLISCRRGHSCSAKIGSI